MLSFTIIRVMFVESFLFPIHRVEPHEGIFIDVDLHFTVLVVESASVGEVLADADESFDIVRDVGNSNPVPRRIPGQFRDQLSGVCFDLLGCDVKIFHIVRGCRACGREYIRAVVESCRSVLHG